MVQRSSICYLASGRPVLAQDTGLGELYQIGKGLLTFSSVEEASAGVDETPAITLSMRVRLAS